MLPLSISACTSPTFLVSVGERSRSSSSLAFELFDRENVWEHGLAFIIWPHISIPASEDPIEQHAPSPSSLGQRKAVYTVAPPLLDGDAPATCNEAWMQNICARADSFTARQNIFASDHRAKSEASDLPSPPRLRIYYLKSFRRHI